MKVNQCLSELVISKSTCNISSRIATDILFVFLLIESTKTTSMEDVSTGALEEITNI